MINKIIDGISIALNEEFSNDYKIYTESVEQGLKEPCFSIVCVNPSNKRFMRKKYFRQNLFCIHYFPKYDEKIAECMSVLERLYDCLEVIMVDGKNIPGTQMNGVMDGGVLSFMVNYDMFVVAVDEKIPMEDLEVDQYRKD